MYWCCQQWRRRVPKLSCVQSHQLLISHKNSTASITKSATKQNQLLQFRNPEAFLSENDARSNMFAPILSFPSKSWYLPFLSRFFLRIEVQWLGLASFNSSQNRLLNTVQNFCVWPTLGSIWQYLAAVPFKNTKQWLGENWFGKSEMQSCRLFNQVITFVLQMCNTFKG